MTAPTDLLAGLVLEDGHKWGDAATGWQWEAASTLLDPGAPPYRWESRPRGGSKTTDLAAVVLVAALAQLPPGSMVDCWAAGRDQARLLMDVLGGFVHRTPGVAALVDLSQYGARTRARVVIEVMSADLATSYGRRPSFVVVDELCQWPAVASASGLWESIASSLPKVPGCRAAVITTSGSPGHWSRRVYEGAVASPLWTVGDVPGPLPWLSEGVLAEQRRLLTHSSYQRFVLNEWAQSEDSAADPEDVDRCMTLDGPLAPQPGLSYIVTLDLGARHDRTVAAVCHGEQTGEGTRVIVDRLQVWVPRPGAPVSLGGVRAWLTEFAGSYNGATVVYDPSQAYLLVEQLRSARVACKEFTFTAQSVGRLASMLGLRSGLLALPVDDMLRAELLSVRMRETSTPGVVRLDHAAGQHDDQAVALGMALVELTERGRPVRGPRMRFRGSARRPPPGTPVGWASVS